MNQTKLNLGKLKPEALSATGGQIYGLDEYVYIKSFKYDDNNNIKVQYYVLLKVDEDTFDLIPSVTKPYFEYSIADGKVFSDLDGYPVYKVDEQGNTMYEDVEVVSIDEETGEEVTTIESKPVKRLDDYTRNFQAFASLLIPSIFGDIKNHRGYHANGDGAIDAL